MAAAEKYQNLKPIPYASSIPSVVPEKTLNRATYASFGKDGVTATTNAHGHLLQITRYFGNKPSGFFCVDLDDMPEPFRVTSRMQQLQRHFLDADKGMRLRLESSENENSWEPNHTPTLSFIQDRWPLFITEAPTFQVEIQYFISGSTVYQIYTFTDKESQTHSALPTLVIDANLLIRDLHFAEQSTWNTHHLNDDSYSSDAPENACCVIRMHRAYETGQEGKDAVALFISPFINGVPQKIRPIGNNHGYCIALEEARLDRLFEDKKMTVTLAYTLDWIDSSSMLNKSPVDAKDLPEDLPAKLRDAKSPSISPLFPNDSHLDFTMRRNLEHILSVCSIPIGNASNDGIVPIALTCGDIAGHRVANAASFYAFQFLLLAYSHFNDKPRHCDCDLPQKHCQDHDCWTRYRILKTCRGHLKWISDKMETDKGSVYPHHWAGGQKMDNCDDNPKFPKRSLMDTPFHIIKAAEFRRITQDETLPDPQSGLKNIIRYWVKNLDAGNKLRMYAFPRPREERLRTFYFPDHALIWWAAKSVEVLGLASELHVLDSASSTESRQRSMSYLSQEIQANVIKRFITENPVLKKRMIAISRSPLETRFLLRMKETILFDAMDLGLFDEGEAAWVPNDWGNKLAVWTNTVDCQPQHEDNQDSEWDHPLQFALAMIMAVKNKCINSRPTDQMYEFSKTVLLDSSSPNGLFPGQLDEDKEPILFHGQIMRDSYWHTTFEVPYILWKYRQFTAIIKEAESDKGCKLKADDGTELKADGTPKPGDPLNTDATQPVTTLGSPKLSQTLEKVLKRLQCTTVVPEASTANKRLTIKKSVPFRNIIDQSNIVELPDEWLYSEPEFFRYHYDISEDTVQQDVEILKSKKIGAVMDNAVKTISRQGTATNSPTADVRGYIINVPRSDSDKEMMKTDVDQNSTIYKCLCRKRTPENAKKRIFHFFRASSKTALICYLSSAERPEISSFFDRHASYDKYFSEDITAALNKWVTEFHLSFYQIISSEMTSIVIGIPRFEEIKYPYARVPDRRRISRAVMSFRFDGDFVDRYWTCHFFEFNPRKTLLADNDQEKVTDRRINGSLKAHSWEQRRILELILFKDMMQEILNCSQEILKEIKKSVQSSPKLVNDNGTGQQATASALLDTLDLFTKVNNKELVSTSQLWHKFQHILEVVEDDLGENLAKITLWMERGKDRSQDRPRWTPSDERDYRPIISKLMALNRHALHDLERCHVNITSFKASLSRNLEIMRSDLELRGADDIRLFTYVTVVFLPISFATGVFSMSDAPSRHTLIGMIITAAVALLATVVALTNAKILDANIVSPILRNSRNWVYAVVGYIYKILLYPCIYFLSFNLLIPLIEKFLPSDPDGKRPLVEKVKKFFDKDGQRHPWEKAYEDFRERDNERNRKQVEEEKEEGNVLEHPPKRLFQRVRSWFRSTNPIPREETDA